MAQENTGIKKEGIYIQGLKKAFCVEEKRFHIRRNSADYRRENQVLRGIDLEVEAGGFCAIMGSSGCGKSTLMNILCGLERPDEGTCMVNGKEIGDMKPRELAHYRNQEIGIVFQGFYLDETRNLIDNVAMPCGYAGISSAERKKRAAGLLESFGLKDEMKKRPSRISGGEQQRVAIARALVNHPVFLFADEPTGNLDEENTKRVMELFSRLHQDGMGIVVVTHEPYVASFAQKTVLIENGRILDFGGKQSTEVVQ